MHSVLFTKCAEWCGNGIAHSTDASLHDHDKPRFGGAHTKDEMCWSLELAFDPRCAVLKIQCLDEGNCDGANRVGFTK